jgi:hypothetical protein
MTALQRMASVKKLFLLFMTVTMGNSEFTENEYPQYKDDRDEQQ